MERGELTHAVHVAALDFDPITRLPRVVLETESGQQVTVPVGLSDAPAITAELDDIALERPMTHQLTCALLAAAGARICAVTLTVGGEHPAAELVLSCADGGIRTQEARFSDAVAIALCVGVPLSATDALLTHSCCRNRPTPEPARSSDLCELDQAAFGKWKM